MLHAGAGGRGDGAQLVQGLCRAASRRWEPRLEQVGAMNAILRYCGDSLSGGVFGSPARARVRTPAACWRVLRASAQSPTPG